MLEIGSSAEHDISIRSRTAFVVRRRSLANPNDETNKLRTAPIVFLVLYIN